MHGISQYYSNFSEPEPINNSCSNSGTTFERYGDKVLVSQIDGSYDFVELRNTRNPNKHSEKNCLNRNVRMGIFRSVACMKFIKFQRNADAKAWEDYKKNGTPIVDEVQLRADLAKYMIGKKA